MLKITELRKEKGISQKKLAEILNISPGNLCEWEKGRIEPSIDALMKLSDIFEVTVDYLLGREDDFGIIKSGTELQLKEDEAKLLSEYRLLDEINKIKAQTFIYALAH